MEMKGAGAIREAAQAPMKYLPAEFYLWIQVQTCPLLEQRVSAGAVGQGISRSISH